MYKKGQWNAICDVCGFKFKSIEIKKRWDGLMVCEDDFEHDHPQKHLRVFENSAGLPWVRSRPADDFEYVCYLYGRSAYADLGEADCAQADYTPLSYRQLLEIKGNT